jgi:hypothetical protein
LSCCFVSPVHHHVGLAGLRKKRWQPVVRPDLGLPSNSFRLVPSVFHFRIEHPAVTEICP